MSGGSIDITGVEADYVIVGSGSAGSALAHRLSEDGRYRVIVIEYGGSDIGPFIQMPAALSLRNLHRVELQERMWYNLNLNNAQYMVPGIVVVLLTVISLILASIGLVREKEIGTLEQLLVTPLKKYQLLLGKLNGVPVKEFGSDKASFADLKALVAETISRIEAQTDTKEGFATAETTIEIPGFPTLKMSGHDYIDEWLTPNFYFHLVTAYDILRAEGLALGKADYMSHLRPRLAAAMAG